MNARELYDRHAARLYAVALRITGDKADAAAVLEQVFVAIADGSIASGGGISDEGRLIRSTRSLALARKGDRSAPQAVHPSGDARSLVEALFFAGTDVAALARQTSLSEAEVRARIRDGIAALRAESARTHS